jgi:ATP-dependent exoDNAse (exonuclease V) alpha subunit
VGKLSQDIQEKKTDFLGHMDRYKSKRAEVQYQEKLDNENIINKLSPLFNAKTIKDALDALENFQILTATKKGPTGSIHLNKWLKGVGKKENSKFFPLIVTENDYRQELFNGDVGVYDGDGNAYFAHKKKDEDYKPYHKSLLPAHDDAFAITIHKSQGSEYTDVAVVFPEQAGEKAEGFFSQELLYTGITRAKSKVKKEFAEEITKAQDESEIPDNAVEKKATAYLYGSAGILKKAIATPVERNSGLIQRLGGAK